MSQRSDYDPLREIEARQRAEAARQAAEKAARIAVARQDTRRPNYQELVAVAARQTEANAAEAMKQVEANAAKAQQQAEEYWRRATDEKQAPFEEAKKHADKLKEERAGQEVILSRIAEQAQRIGKTQTGIARGVDLEALRLREEREYTQKLDKMMAQPNCDIAQATRYAGFIGEITSAVYQPDQHIKQDAAKPAAQPVSAATSQTKPPGQAQPPNAPRWVYAPDGTPQRSLPGVSGRAQPPQAAEPAAPQQPGNRYQSRDKLLATLAAGDRAQTQARGEVTDRRAERSERQTETTDAKLSKRDALLKSLEAGDQARLEQGLGRSGGRSR